MQRTLTLAVLDWLAPLRVWMTETDSGGGKGSGKESGKLVEGEREDLDAFSCQSRKVARAAQILLSWAPLSRIDFTVALICYMSDGNQ